MENIVTKGERTRQAIVEAAKALFYQRGYTNTSFSDIVDRTSVQRGNIYHYFKTKEDILAAVIKQRESEYKAVLSKWDKEYSNPKDRLHCYVHMVAHNRNDLARYGCPIGTLSAELGKESCELQEAAATLFNVFLNWLTEQFTQLGKTKQAKSLALQLLSHTEGVSIIAHVYNNPALIMQQIKTLQRWIDEL